MTRPKRYVLLVEDDKTWVEAWQRDIQEFNGDADKPFIIEMTAVSNLGAAGDILASQWLDCAIADLRIPKGEDPSVSEAENGNELLKRLRKEISVPLAVFSAFPGDADGTMHGTPVLIKTKSTESVGEILTWIVSHNEMMATMREATTRMQRETAHFFHKHIWQRWSTYAEAGLPIAALQKVVTRQVATHVVERLGLPDAGESEHHLLEFYFVPSIRDNSLHTGDLVQHDGKTKVILNPQCDIATGVPDVIIMAECDSVEAHQKWSEVRDSFNANTAKKTEWAEGALRKLATHNLGHKKHFLPPCGNLGPWIVRFDLITTVLQNDSGALLQNRIASIAPPFIPNIVQRFSAYFARIGQPNLDTGELGQHARNFP